MRMVIPAAMLLFSLQACTLTRITHSGSSILKPSELNTEPEKYHDKRVQVRGALYYGPETHIIYESRELNEEMRRRWADQADDDFEPIDYAKYCLTVANPGKLRLRGNSLSGRTIIIDGWFIKNYLDDQTIDTGACVLPTGIIIKSARWEGKAR